MSTVGRTVRLFLVDGSAQSGLITAEIINWTGRILLAPRERIPDLLKRPEAEKTGVYFLFGDAVDASVRRKVYVGESDIVGRRILQHTRDEGKDFFEKVCIVTSSDQNLTKAHVRYLEGRITSIAKDSGRADVLNGNEPPIGAMPESDVADMEFFLEQVRIVLPVLGFDVLRDPLASVTTRADGSPANGPRSARPLELVLRDSRDGLKGSALQVGDEIVVRHGTLARKNPDYAMNQYAGLRDALIADGSLVESPESDAMVFSRDVPFSSPSAAAAVIYGRNANGRTSWRVRDTNQTLKEYEEAQVGDIERLTEAAQ